MGLLEQILEWDKELLLFINSKHNAFLDPFMLVISSHTFWAISCALVILFMIWRGGKWRFIAPLAMLLTIGANSLLNTIVKWLVERPRPIHVEAWQGIIHAIEEYEASYSFYSAHSSNSFSFAVFSLLYFRNKYYTCFALAWAAIVAYSRMYLAKHYPLDILCGTLMGILMGYMGYKIFDYFRKKREVLIL